MSTRRTSLELDAVRRAVRDLAAGQGGVFRRSDLIAWGFEPTIAVTMKRNGTWIRLHHGVYTDRATIDAADGPAGLHAVHAAATIAALPQGVALFGPSAAVMQGLAVDRALIGPVHLVRPRGADCRALRRRITAAEHLPHAIVHVLDVPDELLVNVDGWPMVNADLAACSTALVSSPDWAVATLDSVAWGDEAALERLRLISELWPKISGAGTLRAALPYVRSGAQTPLESLSRVKLMRCGLPEPRLQVPIYDDDGLIGYVDMLFDELGVVGEADGELKYDDRAALVSEKRREDRLRAKGLGVARWGWREAMGSMKITARSIRKASSYSVRWRAS